MYLYEIKNFFVRNKVSKKHVYVVPCDMLPINRKLVLPTFIVCNLSPSNHQGSHWSAIYIDKNSNGTFFDSYGCELKVEDIVKFLKVKCKSIKFSKMQLQPNHSKLCGAYSCMFLIHVMNGGNLENFLAKFSLNFILNDKLIQRMFNRWNVEMNQ